MLEIFINIISVIGFLFFMAFFICLIIAALYLSVALLTETFYG